MGSTEVVSNGNSLKHPHVDEHGSSLGKHNKSLEQSAAIPASTVSLSCLQNCDSLFDSARLLNSMLAVIKIS